MVVQRSRHNLIDFEIATDPKYNPNWHHKIVARELEHIAAFGDRDYKILIIDEPPRHGKSQQVSIDFPAWYLGNNPSHEIITSSYSADLAQDFGGKTREKVSSLQYQTIFPEVKLKEDEKARGRWRTEQGGSYTAVGVGGPITGRGANIAVVDDPIKNREEADSEVMRKKIWEWFTSTLFTRLEPHGVVIVMHTRWHMLDLVGMIMESPELSKRVKHIHLPAISDSNDAYRTINQPLWENRFNREALLEIKNAIGPYDWASLYQGSPILTENQEFKPEWIKAREEIDLYGLNCKRVLTVDSAMSKKTQADFTGFCDNSIDSQNFWNLRAWRMKLAPEELVDALFSLHATNKYDLIGLEETTFTMGLKPYLDAEQRVRGIFLPIVPVKHNQVNKEVRIRGLIPRYASGSVFHIKGRCEDLEEEQRQFPVGIHDDVLDAEAYQLQVADAPDVEPVNSNFIVKANMPDE